MTTNNFIQHHQRRVDEVLVTQLPNEQQSPQRLHQAMRYAVLNGGKRVRPLLVYASGYLFSAKPAALDYAAVAVEYIHCYSLIHDDLPAMDNDDLRRGKPTCHKAFDDATAILAGDALQAQAFALLAKDAHNLAEQRLQMIQTLGDACGSLGMAGGQAIDLAATAHNLALSELSNMHRLKTGALIKASVLLGAIVGGADSTSLQALTNFAEQIGLAFQIQDDILDVEGDTESLGKQQGADQALNKSTYPALVGLDEAKRLAQVSYDNALAALQGFSTQAEPLRQIAAYIVHRRH